MQKEPHRGQNFLLLCFEQDWGRIAVSIRISQQKPLKSRSCTPFKKHYKIFFLGALSYKTLGAFVEVIQAATYIYET